MHLMFAKLLEGLHPKFEELVRGAPWRYGNLPRAMPKQGVYLFSEGDNHLYVGRSKQNSRALWTPLNPGATHRMAAFAFKLAREATGKITASYKAGDDSRKSLMLNPVFRAAFDAAKARIRKMDFRFVEETDQNAQALLEIYCTLALDARYNDFDTH